MLAWPHAVGDQLVLLHCGVLVWAARARRGASRGGVKAVSPPGAGATCAAGVGSRARSGVLELLGVLAEGRMQSGSRWFYCIAGSWLGQPADAGDPRGRRMATRRLRRREGGLAVGRQTKGEEGEEESSNANRWEW